MKKIFLNLILLLVAVATFSTFFSSCKDDELPAATRLFRPVLSDDDIVTGLAADSSVYIKLTWDKYSDANQYVVKIVAADGSDSATITTDSVSCTFPNLEYDTEYNIYIRSVNTETGLESRDYTATATTLDFPTQLINISSSNIIDTQVRVLWGTTNIYGTATVYDTLKIYKVSNDSLVSASAVTSGELETGSKIMRKLSPETEYRVEAYNGGKFRGRKTFTTTASESFAGVVYDLRGLSDDDSYKLFSSGTTDGASNYIDSLVAVNPDQDITIVLQGGVTYRMPTLTLSHSTTGTIKFVTGLTLNGNANFAVSGNFDLASGVAVKALSFEKLFFTEAPLESKKKTDQYYGGTYLFNLSGTGAEVQNVILSSCTVKYKRGICRVKAANIIDNFTIDNCIVDSISNYGITNCDHASAEILNIAVSNSTLSNCDKLFVNTKCAAGTNTINVSHCTFVYCGTDKIYYFDQSGSTAISTFSVTSCLFARPGTLTAGALTNGVYGYRVGTGSTTPNSASCYITSDFNWVLDAVSSPMYPISTEATLSTATSGTLQNPDYGDFTIINSDFKKLAVGDPRWY